MITALELDEFTGVSVMAPEPLAVTPVKAPITEDVQLNVVPPIEDVGKKPRVVPLQISWISAVDEVVMTGLGLTVTTTSTEDPGHPLAVGVIR